MPPGLTPTSQARQAVSVAFGVVAVAATILGLAGFVVSFSRITAQARPSFGHLAPLVPVAIDSGILVFSAAAVILAWLDMSTRWVPVIPWVLTGVSVYLNVIDETTGFGVVAHAALPGLWVVAVGLGTHVVRHRLALDSGTRMDSIRVSRWLLAPVPTFRLWRRMVLWEERSYAAALERERVRLYAEAALEAKYGLGWRASAPARERIAHRLGDLDDRGRARTTEAPAAPREIARPRPRPVAISAAGQPRRTTETAVIPDATGEETAPVGTKVFRCDCPRHRGAAVSRATWFRCKQRLALAAGV